MKPLLRTLLVVNAVVVLLLGLSFIVAPWLAVLPAFESLLAFKGAQALTGQLFGILLIGFAWLHFYAAANGALTAPVARIGGHTMWVAAVVLLIWSIPLGVALVPTPTNDGRYVEIGVGIVLILLGLAQARLGGAVSKRERLRAAGAISAARAEESARQTAINDAPGWTSTPSGESAFDGGIDRTANGFPREPGPYSGTPVGAVSRDATESRFAGGPGLGSEYVDDPLSPASAAPSAWPRAATVRGSDRVVDDREPRFRSTASSAGPVGEIGETDDEADERIARDRRRDMPPSF